MTYGIYENGKVIAKFTAPLTVKSNQPISISDTLSLKIQATKRAAQRWEITTNIEPLSYNANELFVNLVSKGLSEIVTILMPQNFAAKEALTANNPNTLATGSQGSSQVSITNLSGTLPKGTFIKFANHSKIYLTTSTLINSGTINIFPPLISNVPLNTSVNYKNDVIMNCLYSQDTVIGMVYTDGILMDIGTITLVEKL